MQSTTLTMVDGVRVVVPDSLNLITPFVLREQGDWFEDEIRFLRRALQPGEQIIDIGANYGVYTLSMACTVGAAGRVWAYEPATATADFLAQSIEANGYRHVELERCALSAAAGEATLSLHENAEINSLVHRTGEGATGTETVPVVTLDERMAHHGWSDIAFLKIDAEGEERNILKGGAAFFAQLSPLVQYEIKDRYDVHLDLTQAFAAMGYRSYELIAGLGVLTPFDPGTPTDPFRLNLFCCKPDRAARLAARGLLVDEAALRAAGAVVEEARRAYGWRTAMQRLPYVAQMSPRWELNTVAGGSASIEEALALYALSRDRARPPAQRVVALRAAFERLRAACERDPSRLRRASLARVARDLGERTLAVRSLGSLWDDLRKAGKVDSTEPFLVPDERFETMPAPGSDFGRWILAAITGELIRLGAFSSYYAGEPALPMLRYAQQLGYTSEEIARRLVLLEQRFAKPAPAAP